MPCSNPSSILVYTLPGVGKLCHPWSENQFFFSDRVPPPLKHCCQSDREGPGLEPIDGVRTRANCTAFNVAGPSNLLTTWTKVNNTHRLASCRVYFNILVASLYRSTRTCQRHIEPILGQSSMRKTDYLITWLLHLFPSSYNNTAFEQDVHCIADINSEQRKHVGYARHPVMCHSAWRPPNTAYLQ